MVKWVFCLCSAIQHALCYIEDYFQVSDKSASCQIRNIDLPIWLI